LEGGERCSAEQEGLKIGERCSVSEKAIKLGWNEGEMRGSALVFRDEYFCAGEVAPE
jgi:hypothetical protein